MTKNRRHKAETRAYQAATRTSYMVARRQLDSLGAARRERGWPSLAEVLEEHPKLNAYGIGAFYKRGETAAERRAQIDVWRAELAASDALVMDTALWLDERLGRIQTPTKSSYHLKHVMEKDTGLYVANGVFIAAALTAGYTHRYEQPNVLFGVSALDLRRLKAQIPFYR